MNTYILTLKHDNGRVNIKTVSTSIQAAIQTVLSAENCPKSAIVNIRVKEAK